MGVIFVAWWEPSKLHEKTPEENLQLWGEEEERPPQRRTLCQEEERAGRWCWNTPDENAPQPAEGAQAPTSMKKQIHLTLPTSPAHVTTTESFSTFFINHGLMLALQKAFAKRGWSTDQMREFVTNSKRSMDSKSQCQKSTGTRTPLMTKVQSCRWDKSGQEEDHRQCTWW